MGQHPGKFHAWSLQLSPSVEPRTELTLLAVLSDNTPGVLPIWAAPLSLGSTTFTGAQSYRPPTWLILIPAPPEVT